MRWWEWAIIIWSIIGLGSYGFSVYETRKRKPVSFLQETYTLIFTTILWPVYWIARHMMRDFTIGF